MSARDRILNRLKSRLAVEGAGDRQAAVSARLAAPLNAAPRPRPTQSQTEGAARIDQFIAKATAADATVTRIAALDDLPAALAHELRQRNLGQSIRMGSDPTLAALNWSGMETTTGPGRIDEPATLSHVPYAVAETGTLALCSGPENPVTLTFLGETHFAVLHAKNIQRGFEELFTAHRASGRDPRTLNLVTGPSRSADIGQKLQLGAHGPIALHVFVIEDEGS